MLFLEQEDVIGWQNSPMGSSVTQSFGKVFLVGAGPYDPELLTIKAMKRLQTADVVIYDRLVSPEIVAFAPDSSKKVFVGKQAGKPSLSQMAINRLLISYAQRGAQVVRLKGGDPCVFGRGGEEALALTKAQVPFEFVAGITAAIGCAASACIPLTHRGVARSVTFVTGHSMDNSVFPAWAALIAAGQTLVFYMGLNKAKEIDFQLRKGGLTEATPFAIVCQGCSPHQQIYVGVLAELSVYADRLQGRSPVLIIVGDVVSLRAQLKTTIESVCRSDEITVGL